MIRYIAAVALLAAACSPALEGNQELVVGRAMMVPCNDISGISSALLIVESRYECWHSVPGERLGCVQRRQALSDDPQVCSDLIVVDSPSEMNLTGFFTTPFDTENMVASATHSMWGLPCNPGGPFAQGYPDFEAQLIEFSGSVKVTRDQGSRGELAYNLQDPNGDDAMIGTSPLEICR